MKINWFQLFESKNASEDLIAELLIRLHPGAVRIDGSGGDGGRDVQLDADGIRTIWEIKGFPDRLSRSKTRKPQIEKSLATAAQRKPDRWWLVLPLDFNTSEDDWFEGLKEDHSFIAGYLGLTWLNGHFAAHQDLVRSARTVAEELLALAGEHRLEESVLAGGVADALARGNVLGERLNELDPNYALDMQIGPAGASHVTIRPKHDGAPPIEMHVQVEFGPDDDGIRSAIDDALDYGDPDGAVLPGRLIRSATLNGPASLGLDRTGVVIGDVTISGPVVDIDVPCQLKVFEPGQWLPAATMHFRMRRSGIGRLGTTQVGSDSAETIELRTSFSTPNPVAGTAVLVKLRQLEPSRILPVNALPAVRLLAASHAPNTYRLYVDGHFLGDAPCREMNQDSREGAAAIAAAISDLAYLQEKTGVVFELPDEFTGQEARNLAQAAALLRGEDVVWFRGAITVTLYDDRVADFLAGIDETGLYAVEVEHLLSIDIAGRSVEIGPVRVWSPMAKLRNPRTLAKYRPGGRTEPKAKFAPVSGRFSATLIPAFSSSPGNVRHAPVGTPAGDQAPPEPPPA